jgi:drug/metabolite transporter (DMT)-like permease
MSRASAIPALVLTAVLWSMGGAFIKSVDWNPLAIAGSRSGLAAIFMLAVLGLPRFRLKRANPAVSVGAEARLAAQPAIRLSWPLAGAAASTAATMLLFVSATRLTTAANAVVLQYLAPIHVALIAPRFLGEKTHPRDWLALILALGGMVLFFWGEVSPEGRLGITLALASSLTFAGIPLCLRRLGARGGQAEAVLLGHAMLAAVCLPFYFQGPMPGLQGVRSLLILGLVQTGLAYFIYTKAIRHVRALEGMLIPVIEPILNPVWVFLFIGERPSPQAMAGAALVLGAATLQGLLAARAG